MKRNITLVATAIESIGSRLPADVHHLDFVSSRRGAEVWRLSTADGAQFGLKFGVPTSRDEGGIEREADAMNALAHLPWVPYVGHVSQANSHVLLTGWNPLAVPANEIARPARDERSPQSRAQLLQLLARIASVVSAVNDLQWLHGDLQPAHFLMTPQTPPEVDSLLDWGLARPIDNRHLRHPGSLVHYASPEVAAAMLAGSTESGYDLRSEVYSLASVIYFLATGETIVDYGNEPESAGPERLQHRLTRIVDGGHLRSFNCWPFDEHSSSVLAQSVSAEPDSRPSMAAITECLESATGLD